MRGKEGKVEGKEEGGKGRYPSPVRFSGYAHGVLISSMCWSCYVLLCI